MVNRLNIIKDVNVEIRDGKENNDNFLELPLCAHASVSV